MPTVSNSNNNGDTINEVTLNGEVILTTRGNTVTSDTLVQGETAQTKTGESIVGELDPISDGDLQEIKEHIEEIDEKLDTIDENAYFITDNEGEIGDTDYIPFHTPHDREHPKKKFLFSSLVDKIKSGIGKFYNLSPNTDDEYTIPANADLNDYCHANKSGTWYCSQENAETLSNCPVDHAFKLSVDVLDANATRQTIAIVDKWDDRTGESNIYTRIFNQGIQISWWTDWEIVSYKNESFTYEKAVMLHSTDDLNNLGVTQVGTYYWIDGTGYIPANVPESAKGFMYHLYIGRDNGHPLYRQLVFNPSNDKIFERTYNGTSWGVWKDLTVGGGDSKTHTYERGTQIPANSDFDSYSTEGVYYVASNADAETMTNFPPTTSAGKLLVLKTINSTSYFTQIYVAINNKYYSRRYDNNNPVVWTDWVEIANLDDVVTWAQNNIIGSKNLFNSYIANGEDGVGLTYQNNGDGSFTINAGTTTGEFLLPKNYVDVYRLKPNTQYIFSIGVASSQIKLQVYYKSVGASSWTQQVNVTNASEITFNTPSEWDALWIRVVISGGVTLSSDITIYPMIRLASIADNTFEPYGETNQNISEELTKKLVVNLGLPIPANSDLNTYVREGVYYCQLSATARTMTNLPYTGDDRIAFKLIVMKDRYNNNFVQWYIPYWMASSWVGGKLAYRTTDDGGTTWSDWVYVARTTDITPAQIGDGYASATVSGSTITATIDGFQLRAGVIVAIYIPNNVTTACTLNISNTGAKDVKNWTSHDPSVGYPIREGVNTFIYNGTQYKAIAFEKSPRILMSEYVADTSGVIINEWGYDANKAQIKYSLTHDKMKWNRYKNSAWKGDATLADYDDIKHQTVGINIPANSDLNNYTTNGIYCVAQNTTAVTLANCPSSYAGKLVVERIAGNSYIVQTYYTYHQDLAGFGGVFRRSYASSWQPWVYIANIQNDGGNRYLYLMGETTTANDKAVGIKARIKDTTTNGDYTRQVLKVFNDHQATPTGFNLVIDGGGALFLGGGEAGQEHYRALKPYTSEQVFITSDGNIYLQANATTIANRIGIRIDVDGNVLPCKADAITNNQGNIGSSSYKFAEVWANKINGGDIVNSNTLVDTNLSTVQRLGGIAERRIEIPDNSGYSKFIKFCDVTTWFNSTTTNQRVQSFVGWLITSREGGYASRTEIVELKLGVAYEKTTSVNNTALLLFTDNDAYLPVILKETLDNVTKYYLALKIKGAGREGFLIGHFRMNNYSGDEFIGEWVLCTNSSDALPTGYSVEINGKVRKKESAYATCSTSGDSQIKYATIDDSTWRLKIGCIVGVKFTNTNTYSATTDNKIQLNVNGTGAKPIYYNTGYPTGTNTAVFGYANRIQFYMYNGADWVWISAGVDIDSNNRKSFYGTCTTAGDQQIKVVTISDTNGWELRAGTIVGVKFSNSNTYSATADNKIQLNVNGTGAKPIYYSSGFPTGTNTTIFGYANRLHFYMYDGTNWCWLSHGTDNDGNNRKSFYGTCATAGDVSAKVISLSDTAGWELRAGTVVGIKFSNSNTASNVTLNVNNSGAKSIYYNTAVYTGTSNAVCGVANRTGFYMYNGSQWVFLSQGVTNSDTYTSAYCSTAGGTAAKTASCSGYNLLSKSHLHIIMTTANSAKSALTLNVNGKGAKPIYINGSASSSSNYTLPAGSYLIYYNGTNYYFRTDGKITCAGTVTV